MDLSGSRKIVIAGIVFLVPYTLSNFFVFIFLVPILYLLFRGNKEIRLKFVLLIFTILIAIALLPVITYDPGVYFFSILAVMTFLGVFLSTSFFLIKRFGNHPISLIMPSIIWMVLLYTLDLKGVMSSAFDVGVLFPVSAPLIWYVGSIGLTALIILFNTAIARFIVKKDRISLLVSILIGSLFLTANIFSITRLPDVNDGAASRHIALIQGDIPGRSLFGYTDRLSDRINRYLELSRSAEEYDVDLVVWPEFTLPVDVMSRFPKHMTPIIDTIKTSDADYVIGSMLKDPVKESVRYNSALIFGKSGDLEDVYYSESPALFNRG